MEEAEAEAEGRRGRPLALPGGLQSVTGPWEWPGLLPWPLPLSLPLASAKGGSVGTWPRLVGGGEEARCGERGRAALVGMTAPTTPAVAAVAASKSTRPAWAGGGGGGSSVAAARDHELPHV